MMRAISWTRVLVSRALASLDRSWESLARRHGWVETWTLGGSDGEAILLRCESNDDNESNKGRREFYKGKKERLGR